MKTPLAVHNLWHQRTKTLVSVGGVAFALLLVFMQLGFMGAVSHTATNVLENLKFDLLLRSSDYVHLYEPGKFDRKWLNVAASTSGVEATQPFWITLQNWRKLPTAKQEKRGDFQTQYLPIAVMAFELPKEVFTKPEINDLKQLLASSQFVLMDTSTQRDYGPLDGSRFGDKDIGRKTEIGGETFSIAGVFDLGTGLAANGAVIVSDQGFVRIVPWNATSEVSLGLLQVDGENPTEVQELLRQRLMASDEAEFSAVEVLSRAEVIDREKRHWLWQTPIGLIFQLGVLLSLLVGAAIVYMVLATDVASRLSEYATLLAMGYSRVYLASVVMTQAMVLSIGGFAMAWGAAEILYRLTSTASGIPVSMNFGRVVLVALLGIVMCLVSGFLALRKLWKAEPANLF